MLKADISQFTNGLVALITPILLSKSAFGAYFLFGGLSFGTLVVLALYMPETRGEPLESIQEVFSKPLQLHGIERLLQRKFGSSPSSSGQVSGRPSMESSAVELDEICQAHAASVRVMA